MTTILESASRAYRLIAPPEELMKARTTTQIRIRSGKFDAWLREHVIPAIEEYWRRARFRKAATWAQQAFGEEKRNAEWELLNEVASALRQSAKDVLALANAAAKDGDFPTFEAASAMLAQNADEPSMVGSVTMTGTPSPASAAPRLGEARHGRSRLMMIDTALAMHQSQNIRTCKAEDLANADDYFGAHDSTAIINGISVSVGQFLPDVNPRQMYLGNHVARAILTRVTTDRDSLERVRRIAYQEVNRKRRKRLIEREQHSWRRLEELIAQVDYEFLTCNTARIREGCMVLVQVYRDFAPSAVDLDWLRLSPAALANRCGWVKAELVDRADFGTVERLDRALHELGQLYNDSKPDEAEIDEAISLGGLVLLESTQTAYWKGKQVRVDWRRARKPWELLQLLASHGQVGRAVEARDLYRDAPPGSRSTMPNRWRRLKQALPSSLTKCVIPAAKESYLLQLPSDLIHIFPS